MIERRNSRPAALRRLMDTRREIEADIRPRRVMGRNLDGTVQVVPLNGECPENGGLDAQAGVIFTPSVFYGATLGTGPGTNQVVVSSGALRIDTYEPRFLRRGKSQTVQLTGAGFVPSMVVDHISGGDALYPGIDVSVLTVSGPSRAEMVVNVAEDALVGEGGLAYQDVPDVNVPEGRTGAVLRKVPAFEVVPSGEYRWVAWFESGSQLVAIELESNGAYGAEAGRVSKTGFSVLNSSPIPRDPSRMLGDDSAVWVHGDELYLADFRARKVLTRSAAEGRRMAGSCYLPSRERLAWIEWTPGNSEASPVSLWTAATDFSDELEEIQGEMRHAVGGGVGPVEWTHSAETGFAPNAAGVDLAYLGPNGLPSHAWLYMPFVGAPEVYPGFGTDVGIGMPHPSGSIAGADRWDGTSGGEGFAGFNPFLDFEAPQRGAVAGDGSVVLFAVGSDSLRLVEVAPPFIGLPVVDLQLQPHPVLGTPVRVVSGL